jgi:hypothetical protein
MQSTRLGEFEITRFILGGNPFSGFSHQSIARDREMMLYYTAANIKDALRKAEAAGINTLIARTDKHITRLLMEYWEEGGTIQWIGQPASELADYDRAVRDAVANGAVGIAFHGGVVDHWFAEGKLDQLRAILETMRECGVLAGLAGHSLAAQRWIRDNLRPDFGMCSYYEPTSRANDPHHVSGRAEKWDAQDRALMAELIQTIPWPVIHYKVFAAGNKPIDEAWQFATKALRPQDMICVGHFLKENPNMIAENVATFQCLATS